AAAADFDASLSSYAALKAMTSELVGRYVGSTIAATRAAARLGEYDFGRMHGELVIRPEADPDVRLLRTLAVLYGMPHPGPPARQDRQRDRIFRVFDYLTLGAPGSLDPMYRQWFLEADDDAGRARVVVDQIASMTESRLERLARNASGISGFLG